MITSFPVEFENRVNCDRCMSPFSRLHFVKETGEYLCRSCLESRGPSEEADFAVVMAKDLSDGIRSAAREDAFGAWGCFGRPSEDGKRVLCDGFVTLRKDAFGRPSLNWKDDAARINGLMRRGSLQMVVCSMPGSSDRLRERASWICGHTGAPFATVMDPAGTVRYCCRREAPGQEIMLVMPR